MRQGLDLHNHLYGSLNDDDLKWLFHRNKPRWHIFQKSYQKCYGSQPNLHGLFQYGAGERRARYSTLIHRGDFQRFQTAFDFIISLSSLDPAELYEIAHRVISHQPEEYVEYRMLFPPSDKSLLEERVFALSEGIAHASARYGTRASLSISLPREDVRKKVLDSKDLPGEVDELDQKQWESGTIYGTTSGVYFLLKALMKRAPVVKSTVQSIDFCAIEEGHPPALKAGFIARVLKDNQKDPDSALAILYHVGESYTDKTVESAVRWVVQAADMGVHRLGHGVALGICPAYFQGTTRLESVSEYIDHLNFRLVHFAALAEAGLDDLSEAEIKRELESLAFRSPDENLSSYYDSGRLDRLNVLQDWAMERIAKSGVILEACPTSNIRIAGVPDVENHPIHRFMEKEIRVIIGSDDPGILNTSLMQEYELLLSGGMSQAAVEKLQLQSSQSLSSILSGRGDR